MCVCVCVVFDFDCDCDVIDLKQLLSLLLSYCKKRSTKLRIVVFGKIDKNHTKNHTHSRSLIVSIRWNIFPLFNADLFSCFIFDLVVLAGQKITRQKVLNRRIAIGRKTGCGAPQVSAGTISTAAAQQRCIPETVWTSVPWGQQWIVHLVVELADADRCLVENIVWKRRGMSGHQARSAAAIRQWWGRTRRLNGKWIDCIRAK